MSRIALFTTHSSLHLELVELHTQREKMTNSLQDQLNLLLKEEALFDNVHKDIKGLIKNSKGHLNPSNREGE